MAGPLIVIPARIGATRLPRKPLADIAGEPMIVHVWRRAIEADAGEVVVATDSQEIADAIEAAGGKAVITRADHPSGSDRVFEAVNLVDPDGKSDIIVNFQGDQPVIEPSLIRDTIAPLADPAVDIGTLAVELTDPSSVTEPSIVKLVGTPAGSGNMLRALYFTRAPAPFGPGPLYVHIGIYAYRRQALARFVALAPTPLEQREKLEQLRALESGMRIDARQVDSMPMAVDTPADLDRVRAYFAARAKRPAAA
ncbi:MAG TPA: 3-deoxy-manno-octulosonate cytidylyltransferase [Hyphomicrobiales bacterium]|jgi:3-deoxy-manno-octulosonate cytidylyltransferase (CMP-KDO synthetase)